MNPLFLLRMISRETSPVLENQPACVVAFELRQDRIRMPLWRVELQGHMLERESVRALGLGESYPYPHEGGGCIEVALQSDRFRVPVPAEGIIAGSESGMLSKGDRCCVIEGRLRHAGSRTRHNHDQRVIISLNRIRLLDGPEVQSESVGNWIPDPISFGEPCIHSMENVGNDSVETTSSSSNHGELSIAATGRHAGVGSFPGAVSD